MQQYNLTDAEYAFLAELAYDASNLHDYRGTQIAQGTNPKLIEATTAHGTQGWVTRWHRIVDGDVTRFLEEAAKLLADSAHEVKHITLGLLLNTDQNVIAIRESGIRYRKTIPNPIRKTA